MSWFTDLAGRAEELLNRVDQSAAVVLKKDEFDLEPDYSLLQPQSAVGAGVKTVSIVNLVPPNNALTSTLASHQSLVNVGRSASPSGTTDRSPTVAAASKGKSRKQIEEEKLFEFLNSDGVPSTGGDRRSTKVVDNVPRDLRKGVEAIQSPSTSDTGQIVATANAIQQIDSSSQPNVNPSLTSSKSSVVETIKSESMANALREPLTSPGPVSSLEYENRLLHNEVNSLNRELSQMLQRSKNTEMELLGLRKQLENRTKELSAGNQSVLAFHERENDLKQALDAKDSQLAVLRVRLQEADQELSVKRPLVEQLQQESRRMMEDHTSSSGVHSQAIESVQERLRQAEELLEREQTNFRNSQAESSQRILKLENELKSIAASYSEAQNKLAVERSTASELTAQLKTSKHGMECAQQELGDYKTKAQRILQSKERLIASLKQSNSPTSSTFEGEQPQSIVSAVELEELRQERDLLKDEVNLANQQLANLRVETQDGEQQLQEEIDSIREHSRSINEQLRELEQRRQELEMEASQLSEELRYLREDSSRQRTTLQSRLQDRDEEIERLRRQLIAKQVNTTSYAELEARLNALTESLIQKQTLLEALSTEKSSLVFQLERLEQRANETSTPSRRSSSLAVNVSDDGEAKQRVPSFMVENVFDSQVTRKVKRVYNTIDSLSIRFGVFLRRYPMARTLILVYMAMLHLWVMVVLFTYTPEVHGQGEKPTGK